MGLGGLASTDPTLTWREVPPDWIAQTVRPEPGAPEADLTITLDQQLYPALLPLIQQFAAKRQIRIAVREGACGISAVGIPFIDSTTSLPGKGPRLSPWHKTSYAFYTSEWIIWTRYLLWFRPLSSDAMAGGSRRTK